MIPQKSHHYLRVRGVHVLASLAEIPFCSSDKHSLLPLYLGLIFFFVDDFCLIPLYCVALIAGLCYMEQRSLALLTVKRVTCENAA